MSPLFLGCLRRIGVSVLFCAVLLLCLNTVGNAQISAPPPRAVSPATAERPLGITVAQIQAKIEADKKALADDPVASVRRLLGLPPVTQTAAAFQGNQTALTATSGNGFAMVRNLDCSLTAFNAAFVVSASNSTATYTSQSVTPGFEQAIHSAAGLSTTPDQFKGGCAESSVGAASGYLVFVGKTTAGVRVIAYAAPGPQANHPVTYLLSMNASGALIGTTILPDSPGGNYPASLLALDLNDDGNNDLISFEWGGSAQTISITILLGKPDGTFQPGKSYTIPGIITYGGVIDDFDGDGNLDIAVETTTPSTYGTSIAMAVLPGKGDGTFGVAKVTPLMATTPIHQEVVSGDFNGDGKKDLVSGYGLVLLGKGDGTFTQTATPAFTRLLNTLSGPLYMTRGDFNNDGKLDLAAGYSSSIDVFLGNGDGTFAATTSYANIGNVGQIAVTDIDGDGNLDLYSGTAANGGFGGDGLIPNVGYALMGNGDGTFRGAPHRSSTVTGDGNTPLAANLQSFEDLNGDGKLDYLVLVGGGAASNGAPNIPVTFQNFLGRGDGHFTGGPSVVASPISYNNATLTFNGVDSYTLVDVNGDGHLDLVILPVAGGISPYGFEVALGKADGSFQDPTFNLFPSLIAGGGADTILQIAGISSSKRSDGKFELIYHYNVQSHTSPYPSITGIATQVINGDGTFAAPAMTVIQSTNGASASVSVPLNVADVSGDQNPDLIYFVPAAYSGGSLTPATLSIALGKADGTFAAQVPLQIVDNPHYLFPITIADVNGDGKPDLLALGSSNATGKAVIGVALGNGDGTFQAPRNIAVDTPGDGFESLAAADFDGDGKVDIAMLGYEAPFDSGVFLGNGDGTFRSSPGPENNGTVIPLQPLYLLPYNTVPIVADIDGDGKPDIAGSTFLLNRYNSASAIVATSTALTASPASISTGQAFTLTATVTAASGVVVPAGTVTFLDGTTSLGTTTLNGQGVASLTVTTLLAGSHTITATYPAGSNFSGSISSPATVIVAAPKLNATATLTTSSHAFTVGQSITLTATVVQVSGFAIPTGTVTFLNGSTALGTANLNAQGVATLAVSTLPVGNQTITANYSGDATFNSSTAIPVTVAVTAAVPIQVSTTTTLTTSSSALPPGGSVTFTATVRPVSGNGLPTGTVTFLNAATNLGAAALNPQGISAFTTTTLPSGTASIVASYSGDSSFVASASSAVTVTVSIQPDFGLSLASLSGVVVDGNSAQTTLTLAPANGFSGTIALGCSGLPKNASCIFNPASVTLGTAPATSTLIIRTGTTQSALIRHSASRHHDRGQTILATISLCGSFGFLVGWRRRVGSYPHERRFVRLSLLVLSFVFLASFAAGCGSGSFETTPSGTYLVNVTATAGSVTHTATFSMTVQ